MRNRIQVSLGVSALALFLTASMGAQQSQSTTQAPPAAPPQTQPAGPPTSDQPAPPPTDQTTTPSASSQGSPAGQGQSSQTPDQATPPAGGSATTGGATAGPGNSAAQASGVQTFSGTIVKQGDKYMLQDEASGQTYDVDHQDEVQKYVGKRVRVHGTLDPSGKTIRLQ